MPRKKDLFLSRLLAFVAVLLTAACWNHASPTLAYDWTHADSDPNSAGRSLDNDDDLSFDSILCAIGFVGAFAKSSAEKVGGGFVDVTALDQTKAGRKTQISGYVNGAFYANTFGADYNGGINADSESGFSLNGAYIAALKEPETDGKPFDWGFGVDFMFGEDSRQLRVEHGLDERWYTGHNRAGDPTYGFAMPQLYGSVAYNKWTFTAGHFNAPVGYESARADERFFFTNSLSTDIQPATMTGGLLTYSGIESFTTTVGFVNGMDQGFSDRAGGSLLIGNFEWRPTETTTLSYSFAAGDYCDRRLENGQRHKGHGSFHTLFFEYAPDDQWTFATTADYVNEDVGPRDVNIAGLGQHVYYAVDDSWKFGARVEWRRLMEGGSIHVDDFGFAVGVGYTPMEIERLSIRPELRFDTCNVGKYGGNCDKKAQLCLGVEALYSF
ncbi:MAG: outer membrane beta-barrel protein [Thermoguttaceae bacterium]|nr:outer membrane beta-barrel protein [Thermoguttaceae bacterium]